jgi:arylsulfatase
MAAAPRRPWRIDHQRTGQGRRRTDGYALQLANIDKAGSPSVASHYAAGWAWATSTPFQWMKQVASHFGGTRNPLIIDWPGHTSQPGAIRSQFGHVNDIAPTVLDAAGIRLPETVDGVPQLPFEGKSLLPTLTDPHASDIHTEQYFEIFGNRAIYKDGWVAAAKRDYQPWNLLTDIPRVYADTTDQDHWELYHVATDFSEADDSGFEGRLAELKAEFEREGKRNDVFPLLPLPIGAPTLVDPAQRHFDYRSDISGLPTNALPALIGRPIASKSNWAATVRQPTGC